MKYWKNTEEVDEYSPPGHTGTWNRRLIGMEEDIQGVEVIVGKMEPGGYADPHKHADLEQVMFILEGSMLVTINGSRKVCKKDEVVWIPKGVEHEVKNPGEETLRFILIYTPPKTKLSFV